MNKARKTNSSRLLLGMTVALTLCATQPLYAYCAGGVVGGVATVYKCDNTCFSWPSNLQRYSKQGCVIICCPDGSKEYNPASCDSTTWSADHDFLGRSICCDTTYSAGDWYTNYSCAPAGE